MLTVDSPVPGDEKRKSPERVKRSLFNVPLFTNMSALMKACPYLLNYVCSITQSTSAIAQFSRSCFPQLCLAIVHPLRSLVLLGRRQTCLLCVVVWVGTLLLSIPVAGMTLIQTCPGSNRTVCTLYILLSETGESLSFSLVCSAIGFLFPLFSICYCGLRSVRELRLRPRRADPHNQQRRLRRVLCAALVFFALFYLPYHMSRNAAIVMRVVYPDSPASWRHADLAFSLEMCLCSLITCINPMFSCFMGRQFRREFHGTFAAMFFLCPGTRLASVISKRTRMTVKRRQGLSTVAPVCALPVPGPQ